MHYTKIKEEGCVELCAYRFNQKMIKNTENMPRLYDIMVFMMRTLEDITSFKVTLMTIIHKYNQVLKPLQAIKEA